MAAPGSGSGSNGAKPGPLSLNELLAKKKSDQEANLKPKFMSKAEREAQRRAEEEAKTKSKNDEKKTATSSSSKDPFGRDSFSSSRNEDRNRSRSPPPRRRTRVDDEEDVAYKRRRDDRRGGGGAGGSGRRQDREKQQKQEEQDQNRDSTLPLVDRDLLKARYLGAQSKDKRKIRKMSDRKFVFDWDKSDDTGSGEYDPIYRSLMDNGKPAGAGQTRLNNKPSQQDPDDVPLAGPGNIVARKQKNVNRNVGTDERHWSDKKLSEMTNRDWRIFKEDYAIAARGGQVPNPIRSWEESDIPPEIKDVIEEIGYKEPSPIQRQAIPLGLLNRDMIGVAETGSGKTAAFVIPMLRYIGMLPKLNEENRHMGPYALVLAPTRELAQQIETETRKFTTRLGYKCVSIVGGHNVEEQQFSLRDGAEVVIATPGRLKDVIERRVMVLTQCTYVVLDEADRMVSLGFEEVLNFILDSLPVSNIKPDTEEAEDSEKMMQLTDNQGREVLYRQTVMFSATMPPAVERLTRRYLRRPAHVTIGVAGQAVDTVEQRVEFFQTSSEDRRKARLLDILNSNEFESPIIVFVNQKKTADQIAKDLNRAKWSSTTLHSGKNQEQREASLAALRDGSVDILVATDLAGRGIDVPDVTLVVNFQMATTIEAYVHRIGRTGRAGKKGVAITLLTNDDTDVMYDLKQEIMKSPISKCPPELAKHEAAQQKISRAMKKQAESLD